MITIIRGLKPDKAPGIDGIPNRMLQLVVGEWGAYFTHLFQACVDLNYHPKHFKKANTVVIKKPLKNGMTYANPKMYRPIALLSTLGKALETFFARTITRIAEEKHLLPNQQMGARKKRSTESALETLTDAIHTVFGCGKKHVATLMSLDVSGAFDHVSHPRLLHNLKMKGLPA